MGTGLWVSAPQSGSSPRRALLEAAWRLGKERGAQRCTLLVWPFNQEALGFYHGLGFSTRSITLEAKL